MFAIRIIQFFLCGVMVWSFQQDPIQDKPIEDRLGTLLITEGPIAFTSLTWRLVFEWDLTPLEETLKNLRHIHHNLTILTLDNMEKEALIRAGEALETAQVDFDNFINLVRGTRQWYNMTRQGRSKPFKSRQGRQVKEAETIAAEAWTGNTGSIMSSILGLASSEELDNVHAVLDTLFRREAKMVTVQKFHITAVKKLQSQLAMQQEQLDRQVNISAMMYLRMGRIRENRTEYTNFGSLLMHSGYVAAVGLFKAAIIGHRQVLTQLNRGYVDSDLIPPKALQDSLLQIKDNIPAGFKLIFDPANTNLKPYYNLKLASRLAGSENIRGMLEIPLTGMAEDFVLYRSVPFPSMFGDRSQRRFILQDVTRFVAISSDRRRFVDLDSVFNAADCMQGPTLVCPAMASVLSNPSSNCIFHLIAGSPVGGSAASKCQMREITTDEVYMQGIDTEEWAISSTRDTLVTSTCIDLNSSSTNPISYPGRKIKGDTLLHVPRYCSVTVDHHQVPMRLQMTTEMGKLPSRLNLPPLHTHQLLNLHGAQILNDKLDKELGKAVKDLVEYHHGAKLAINASAKDVEKMVSSMTQGIGDLAKMQPEFHYHFISWSLAILCLAIAIGIGCWVKCRRSTPFVRDIQLVPMAGPPPANQ